MMLLIEHDLKAIDQDIVEVEKRIVEQCKRVPFLVRTFISKKKLSSPDEF